MHARACPCSRTPCMPPPSECGTTSGEPIGIDGTAGIGVRSPNSRAVCATDSRPDIHAQLHGHGVDGKLERIAHQHRPEKGRVVIVGRIYSAIRHFDVEWRIVQHGGRRHAAVQRRIINERLECRTRLTHCLNCAVELRVAEVAAADECAHIARGRIERDEHPLEIGRLGSHLAVLVRDYRAVFRPAEAGSRSMRAQPLSIAASA